MGQATLHEQCSECVCNPHARFPRLCLLLNCTDRGRFPPSFPLNLDLCSPASVIFGGKLGNSCCGSKWHCLQCSGQGVWGLFARGVFRVVFFGFACCVHQRCYSPSWRPARRFYLCKGAALCVLPSLSALSLLFGLWQLLQLSVLLRAGSRALLLPPAASRRVKGFPHLLARGRVEQGVLADFSTLFPRGRAVLAGKGCRLLAVCSLPPGAEGRQAVCRAASSEPRVSQAALSPAAGFDVIYRRDQLRHPGC